MVSNNILDLLAARVIVTAASNCPNCVDPNPCEFHSGFIDGVVALVATIESELTKVGYVGP